MVDELSRQIEAQTRDVTLPDATRCRTIGVESVSRLSENYGVDQKTVEIEALKRGIFPDRYLRNRNSLSVADQLKLREATVCIVGLGGLGGLVAETAARLGIGRLLLIDGDRFEAHNLNRQLFSRMDRLGMPKAEAAASHIEAINPAVALVATPVALTSANAPSLIDDSCGLVVDCLDTIHARFDLQRAARQIGIPMVSSAIAGMCGHVTTIFPQDVGLELIYGPEAASRADTGAESHLGCLAPAVNLIASLASTEIMKVLLGRDHQLLRNRLLVVDLGDYTVESLQLC